MLDALDTITSVGLGKENSGVLMPPRPICVRASRLMACGTRYTGQGRRPDGALGGPKVGGKPAGKDKDVADAIWLTLRVLVILARDQLVDPVA